MSKLALLFCKQEHSAKEAGKGTEVAKMDKRLLTAIVCPVCREELEFRGEASANRLLRGKFRCLSCGFVFPVIDEVPILIPPGTDMHGARWKGHESELAEWIPQNFARAQRGDGLLLEQEFIERVQAVDGIVLDVASGPCGSFCVEVMQDGRADRLLVMSDLGTQVMLTWRRHLREVFWGDRCSNLVFDARRMPFQDGSVASITSFVGFLNIFNNRLAYVEAARVLSPGGQMLDITCSFEEGGPSEQCLTKIGHIGANWILLAKSDLIKLDS